LINEYSNRVPIEYILFKFNLHILSNTEKIEAINPCSKFYDCCIIETHITIWRIITLGLGMYLFLYAVPVLEYNIET